MWLQRVKTKAEKPAKAFFLTYCFKGEKLRVNMYSRFRQDHTAKESKYQVKDASNVSCESCCKGEIKIRMKINSMFCQDHTAKLGKGEIKSN